ncbi:MAG TPA: glycosyltransferase [Usitatibacter sp.]|nr:glycosyltransferase [Usitatibacter sp.]
MREVDLSVVTYRPDLGLLGRLLASLSEPTAKPLARNLLLHDNSADPRVAESIAALPQLRPGGAFARVELHAAGANLGFGRGHNAALARGAAPFALLLNQDCVLEPGVLDALLEAAEGSAADVAAWELRQIPYEHPKAYDPVTLETHWASAAALLVRRAAFEAVGGFDPRLFMYGEDVDLSWRLRAAGWRILYQPKLAAVHDTYREPGEVKPAQVFGGVLASLCLRARYGGLLRTMQGLAMLAMEITAPSTFPGRRLGLARAGLSFLARWPTFARTRVRPNAAFRPKFAGWGFETRRDGAFHRFASRRDAGPASAPRVSILIRTCDRPGSLREALASCANQTHGNLEVVVVEDGLPRSGGVVEEFRGRLELRYRATGGRVGRARAGNLALAEATGEWLNFLDDDDVLFADHVEVLLEAALDAGVAGAYGLAWETQTAPGPSGRPEEVMHSTRHRQAFDRLTLWHHNFLPIQAVLFHRRLYERHGGFAEDMDRLEDWNLWTRYTLADRFVLVEKTTSKYRVPADAFEAAERQALLDRAYAEALERQRAMRVTLSPRQISEMADAYARSQTVVMVTRGDLRRFVRERPMVARLAAWRQPALEWMRRRRILR